MGFEKWKQLSMLYPVDRRSFLTAASTVISLGADAPSGHQVDRARPVREKPLHAGYFGTSFYGAEEHGQLAEVVKLRRPFRWYGPGGASPSKVATFERLFAGRMQTRYALALTSGSAALQAAMAALEVGPGDEVILPAWTWYSCYNAIVLAGALPVFAEIDGSFNLDPADLESKITRQTRVILAVHLLGTPCDMDRILAVARQHQIRVVEDCAQSLGAQYKEHPLGSLGDIGIYSFQINKSITSGEGGALVTKDSVLFERASRYHDLGLLRAPHTAAVGRARLEGIVGSQFRMSEFTGAVLLAQLPKLDPIVKNVRAVAQRVRQGIQDIPGISQRPLPDAKGDLGSHVFLAFASREQRDRFITAMTRENVPAQPPSGSVILPVQPHIEKKHTVHPAWPSFTSPRGASIAYGAGACPRTINILERAAGIALDPTFTRSDTDDIVAAIQKVFPSIAGA
jgi:8-amino-3,8-dideoxy-alpha-D-manno-octulosonate transaminase